ncbi:MAG: YdeI/OmpD-associated family protein [Candidatus Eremiobacteraeota bacterium]|nr:YdeI/OmpD-associated family protein [Candidatus Eremiobacteraeota bacterium]
MREVRLLRRDERMQLRQPADLRKALAAAPAAKAKWDALTPISRRDFVSWIESAKQAETRSRRIERACDMLVAGKRRPCCYAIVPLDLHLALKATPTAKAGWSALPADAKRDVIGWIESAKQKDTRKRRIAEACVKLAAGKRRPA